MKRETKKLLFDAWQACQWAAQFTHGKSFEDYDSDMLLSSAVERQFEIIGEALNQAEMTDDTLTDLLPSLRQIVGLRNRLIHGYATVNNLILWQIVQEDLPVLSQKLDVLLNGS